jgi:hypothetical protein
MSVNEALAEMYFFQPLMSLIGSLLRDQHFKTFRYYKPSQYDEAFYGFDQSWAKTPPLTRSEFLDRLKQALKANTREVDGFYLGFFLQFKVPDYMKIRSQYSPDTFSPPYYRFELDLKPNKLTALSQHETLIRLRAIKGANVDENEIVLPADLAKLRIVPLADAPDDWNDGARHFIAFQTTDSQPHWCSESVPGTGMSVREWVAIVVSRRMSTPQLIHLLTSTEETLRDQTQRQGQFLFPSNLVIVEARPG